MLLYSVFWGSANFRIDPEYYEDPLSKVFQDKIDNIKNSGQKKVSTGSILNILRAY